MPSTFSNDEDGCPLQLISAPPGNNGLHLNKTNLDKVFEKIDCNPVSVVAIVGPPRLGKSLVISYVVRYLVALTNDEMDLMGWQKKTKPINGFFSSGVESANDGIWIWSEPFFTTNDDGERTAIILLDCQGISPDLHQQTIHLLNVTVLASSSVIFNFKDDIPDSYISYLKTCFEYGKTFKDDVGDDEGCPFQHIIFLIRDWEQPEKFHYGEKGGKLFLKNKVKAKSKFIECVYANFEKVNCFLLPPPGDKCNSSGFQGSISELSTPFTKQLETFINGFVGENTVSPKKILQEQLSATHLRNSIVKYTESFFDVALPSEQDLMETTEEIVNDMVLQNAIQAYKKSFVQKKPRKIPYYSDEGFQKAHVIAHRQALSVLRNGPKLGNAHDRQSGFKKQLDSTFLELKQDNKKVRSAYVADQTESITSEFRNRMEDTFAVFEENFELYDENNISREGQSIMSELIDQFSEKFPHELEETRDALIESVQEALMDIVTEFRKTNVENHRDARETLESMVENLHSNFSFKVKEYFHSHPFETSEEKLQKTFATLTSAQENAFQSKRKPGTRAFYGSYQQDLAKLMDQTFADLKGNHVQRIRSELEKTNTFIAEKCSQLEQKLQGVLSEGGMNSAAIRMLFEVMSAETRREFQSANPFPPDTMQFKEMEGSLQRSLQEIFDNILKLDNTKKQEVQKTYQDSVSKAVSICDAEFKSLSSRIGSSFLTEEALKKECQKIKEKTLREYSFMPKQQSSSENDVKARTEIENHVSKQMQVLLGQNESQKKLAEKTLENFLTNLVTDYKRRIIHETERCIAVAQLSDIHKQVSDDLCLRINEFGSAFDSKFTQKYVQQLTKNIDKLFVPIKNDFQEKIRVHNIEMKGILVDGQQFYHNEMGKHFENNQFIKKDDLLKYHQKAKQEAMRKCEAKSNKLTELQRQDLSNEIDGLFTKYKDKNFMNVEIEGSENAPAIGIDLGTTYCCVGVYYKKKVHIIPNVDQGNEKTTPSYVCIDSEGNETIGKPAKDNAYQCPEVTIYDAKRIIGRKMNDPDLQSDMKFWPFTVKEDGGVPKILVHNKLYHPEEISSKLLKYFRVMAEKFLGLQAGTIRKAVITVPAYFNDGQRQATIDAGELAELEVLTILNEPTAAAISYSMERLDSSAKNILVYDLGGGTFDVAVLEATSDGLKVLGVNGDTHLGGQDFDKNVMTFCVERFEEETGINLFENKDSSNKIERDECHRRLRRLQTTCENCKKDLTSARRVRVQVDAICSGKDLSIVVTQTKFNELNSKLFQNTIDLVRETLKEVKLSKESIDDIVLVGGSSRIPEIQKMLEDFFDGKALNRSINPDFAVGYGAAVHAAKLNGQKTIGDFNLPNFTDVTPMPIGIEIVTGELSVILEKNTKIPTVRSQDYYTVHNNQRSVVIPVYQGENLKLAKQNKLLGSFTLSGLKPFHFPFNPQYSAAILKEHLKKRFIFQFYSDAIETQTFVMLFRGKSFTGQIVNSNRSLKAYCEKLLIGMSIVHLMPDFQIRLTGIPPGPPGKEPIDISMEINSMGVLRVEAVCRSTKGRNSITVVEDKQRMSADAKQRILASNNSKKR